MGFYAWNVRMLEDVLMYFLRCMDVILLGCTDVSLDPSRHFFAATKTRAFQLQALSKNRYS